MIPDYQSIMLPLLQILSKGKEYTMKELLTQVGDRFELTDEERNEFFANGKSGVLYTRVSWAKTYLKKAGLVANSKKGIYQITEEGRAILAKQPTKIDKKILKTYDSFNTFIAGGNKVAEELSSTLELDDLSTPEENLEEAYREIQRNLADELRAKLLTVSPAFFERLVVELLVKMGYGGSIEDAGKAIGKSGDEGIDGIIKEDKLGLDTIYIQAKRWQPSNTISRPELQKFVGALAGKGAKKGVFITTSSFTKEALNYEPKSEAKIALIDGAQLTQLMIEYNLGCTSHQVYEIKRMDTDYFEEMG